MRMHRRFPVYILVVLSAVFGLVGGYIAIDSLVYYFTGTPQLCRAVERGDLPEVQRLIRLGASPSRWEDDGEVYRTPLEDAIFYKHLPVVRFLVEHGAGRYNTRSGVDALNAAAGLGSQEILEYLMQHFPQHDKRLLLYYAAGGEFGGYTGGGRRLDNVEYLLAHGAQPEINKAFRSNGERVLHRAWTPEIAACLLAHGAQPQVKDNAGRTPLHFAAIRGNLPLVKFYIEHGLNVNDKTADGDSVLKLAAYNNRHPEVVAYLKAHKAR